MAKQNFHGGCLGCTQQAKHGIKYCMGCQYFEADWGLPDLSRELLTKEEKLVIKLKIDKLIEELI